MKNTLLLTYLVFCTVLFSCTHNTNHIDLPSYKAADQELHNLVVDLDKKFFDAYNTCDSLMIEELVDEDLEFYHDLGGLVTSKAQVVQALKDNICNKVTRELIEGTIEVYPIPNYGAIEMGWHQFYNSQEPNAKQKPSKFVTIWKQNDDLWTMTRVVSLH